MVQHGEKLRQSGDPGLTALGREQAERTAGSAANRLGLVAVWASPLRRAVETAMPLAAAIGVEVGIDPRLRERMNWEGEQHQALDDFLAEWQVATNDRSYVPRSGDSSEQAAARFIEAIAELTDPLATDSRQVPPSRHLPGPRVPPKRPPQMIAHTATGDVTAGRRLTLRRTLHKNDGSGLLARHLPPRRGR